MAKANPFRFSTKYQDDETDLLYYGYRYYSASMGRWLSQDPIGERGGLNLFCLVENSPVLHVDGIGACKCEVKKFTVKVDKDSIMNTPSDGRVRIEISADYGGKCECCHYRQLAEGHFLVDGRYQEFVSGSGYNINDEFYVQDGPDDAHRDMSNPCHYEDVDIPGFSDGHPPIGAKNRVDFYLSFEFEIYDSCDNDAIRSFKTGWISIVGQYRPYPKRRIITYGGFDQ